MTDDLPPKRWRPAPFKVERQSHRDRWQERKGQKLSEGVKLPSLASPKFLSAEVPPTAPNTVEAPPEPNMAGFSTRPEGVSGYATDQSPKPIPPLYDTAPLPYYPAPDIDRLQRLTERLFGYTREKGRKQKPNIVAEILKDRWKLVEELGRGPKRRRAGPRSIKYTVLEGIYRAGWTTLQKSLLDTPDDPQLLRHFSALLDTACHQLEADNCRAAIPPSKIQSEWTIVCTWMMQQKVRPNSFYARLVSEGGTEKIRRLAAQTRTKRL